MSPPNKDFIHETLGDEDPGPFDPDAFDRDQFVREHDLDAIFRRARLRGLKG